MASGLRLFRLLGLRSKLPIEWLMLKTVCTIRAVWFSHTYKHMDFTEISMKTTPIDSWWSFFKWLTSLFTASTFHSYINSPDITVHTTHSNPIVQSLGSKVIPNNPPRRLNLQWTQDFQLKNKDLIKMKAKDHRHLISCRL